MRRNRQAQAAACPARLVASRSVDSYWDDDGILVIRARLTADQGAVFLKALHEREDLEPDISDDTVGALRADALARVCELALTSDGEARTADRYQVRIDVPAGTLATEPTKPEDMPVLQDDGPPLSLHTLRRVCCDDAHHIVHWADGGETFLDNLILLCRRHHRYFHELGYRIEPGRVLGDSASTTIPLQFFTPRGTPIEASGDRRSRGNAAMIFAANDAQGIRITPDTTTPHWDGKPADYDHILWTLMMREERRKGLE